MDLKTINLLKLQTGQMQEDKTTQAFCASFDSQFQAIANDTEKCILLANIDKLPEDVLDELAVDLHIDWYDANADIDVKRNLIKNSDKVHMYLGTPFAVEQVVQDYFGDGVVEEWFEYGGDPYHFRVVTSNSAVTGELANQFAQAIEKVKRKSTRLELVVVSMVAEFNMYYGHVLQTGTKHMIEQVV